MCAGKESALKEKCSLLQNVLLTPSESLTSDTRETNPTLSPFHLPTLTRTTDTCHTLVPWEDGGEEKHRETWSG